MIKPSTGRRVDWRKGEWSKGEDPIETKKRCKVPAGFSARALENFYFARFSLLTIVDEGFYSFRQIANDI